LFKVLTLIIDLFTYISGSPKNLFGLVPFLRSGEHIVVGLVVVLWHVVLLVGLCAEAVLDDFVIVCGSLSCGSWVDVGDSFCWWSVVLALVALVFSPDDVVVDISLVVAAVQVLELVSEVVFNLLNITDSVMRCVMLAEVVSINVWVLGSRVVMLAVVMDF